MSALEVALFAPLVAYLGFAVAAQFGAARRWLRPLDAWLVLPDWRFFTPSPVRFDYHLLVRDRLPEGALTDWTELSPPRPRSAAAAIWNPRLRRSTPVEEAAIAIFRQRLVSSDSELQHTAAYALLLNHVAHQPRWVGAVATQFMVAASQGAAQRLEPRLVYVSPFHALDSAC